MAQLTDFGERNVTIARRISWSKDGRHIYGSMSDVDADIVMLAGLTPPTKTAASDRASGGK